MRLLLLRHGQDEIMTPTLGAFANHPLGAKTALPIRQHHQHDALQPSPLMQPLEQGVEHQAEIAAPRNHQPEILQSLLQNQ